MRRIDRAIFAIFLLALVADVARAYASAPVSSEVSGSLIFSAASQFQSCSSADAVFAFRRSGSQASPERRFDRRSQHAPIFAAWSKALLSPSAQWGQLAQLALVQPAFIVAPPSASRVDEPQPSPFSPLAQIERAGNPAP